MTLNEAISNLLGIEIFFKIVFAYRILDKNHLVVNIPYQLQMNDIEFY